MEITQEQFMNEIETIATTSSNFPGQEWTIVKTPAGSFVKHRSVEATADGLVLTKEYHICFNPSYGVPVLYFNIWTQDGKLLPIEQVWQLVCSSHKEAVLLDPWTAISQQEHPHLGAPWFHIHPCHTAKAMSKLSQSTTQFNYVLSWLSMFGPVVGLSIPNQMMTSIYKQADK
uniref:Ubiquitin-like-conjugating enzyme ATG10 n=1 Tax=Plectus sambesii TaxID=2011161 RepID=A0A914WND5_9BILA